MNQNKTANELTLEQVGQLFKTYENFPRPGILFYDIHPIMANAKARKVVIEHLYARYRDKNVDAVVGIESRGYYFGISLADRLGVAFVPIRKKGKLPSKTVTMEFGKEYGRDVIELQADILQPESRVILIDDLLATGGTIVAACELLKKVGAKVVEIHCLVELKALNGKAKLPPDIPFYSIYQF